MPSFLVVDFQRSFRLLFSQTNSWVEPCGSVKFQNSVFVKTSLYVSRGKDGDKCSTKRSLGKFQPFVRSIEVKGNGFSGPRKLSVCFMTSE